MPRYIDADAIHYVEIGKGVEIALASDIDKIPTISPDEVRGVGEWISERDGSIVELDEDGYVTDSCHCSVCNEHLDGSEEYAVKGNYCPNCGAKMEVREDA